MVDDMGEVAKEMEEEDKKEEEEEEDSLYS